MIAVPSTQIKRKDPHKFASSVKKHEINKTLSHITEVILATYVCGQFGWHDKLNDEQILIYKVYGKPLSDRLGFELSNKVNDTAFIWARENVDNYNWMYTLWVALNKKYFDFFEIAHDGFKFSSYVMMENIFPNEEKK